MIVTHLEYMHYLICTRALSSGAYKATIRASNGQGKIVAMLVGYDTLVQAEDAAMDWIDSNC